MSWRRRNFSSSRGDGGAGVRLRTVALLCATLALASCSDQPTAVEEAPAASAPLREDRRPPRGGAAAPVMSVGKPALVPDTVQVGQETIVTATAVVVGTIENPLRTKSVRLGRVKPDNKLKNLGRMRDDGTRGDAVAGDGIYTIQEPFEEPLVGPIPLVTSARFRRIRGRVRSEVVTLTVARLDVDDDSDGFSENQGDCDDTNPAIRPNAAETCNGIDDDCDDSIDDGFPVGGACNAGVGACQRAGTNRCAPDGTSVVCDATPGTPATEICNGADDDCDGTPDDGFDVNAPCSAGIGACETDGTKTCTPDHTGTVCNAVPGTPQTEICGNGIDEDCDGGDPICAIAIAITSPPNLTVFNRSPVQVSGSVGPEAVEVECGGFLTEVSGGTFTGSTPLREGRNSLTCTARAVDGVVGTATIQIVLDTTPPVVVVDSPPNGFVTTSSQIDITGSITDATSVTIEAAEPSVIVNGIEAAVANRSFAAARFLLQPGVNAISISATDAAGNVGTASLNVTLLGDAEQRLQELSGNSQRGTISEFLPEPLVVRLTDRRGNPIAGRAIDFTVTRGDGTVGAFPDSGRSVTARTDDNGIASVSFVLGTRVGRGNHEVTASALGVPGAVVFCASADGFPPQRIVAVTGGNQTGTVGNPLPLPLVTLVTDAMGNPVPGVEVVYQVTDGGGTIGGQTTFADTTDSEGHAGAVLTLGTVEGLNNNVVTASFADLIDSPAVFSSTALRPDSEPETRVSGIVLDNQDDPVPGATARIEGTALSAVTDAQGRFTIGGAPVGSLFLIVDGTTTTRPGTWPELIYEMVTVTGRDNTVGMPIRLLPIDTAGARIAGGPSDVTIPMAGVPGAELTVFANSVTFPDGSHVGPVSFTQVHGDKVPMQAPLGSSFMLAFTVQPRGTRFDPPARVSIPNIGAPPGEVVEMFSFDHDIGEFVSIGTASVTEDGQRLVSNPGFGIRKAGWGGCAPPPPPPNCTCSCDDGNRCTQDNCSGPPRCRCSHQKLTNSSCCDGREIDPATQGCCDGRVYQKSNQCCVDDEIKPKNADGTMPLEDPSECPNRSQNSRAHEYDGCSVPGWLPGIGDRNNPAGGSDTHFSNGALTGGCDLHDTCYQTCSRNDNARLVCDQLLRDTAVANCNASSEPQAVRDNCRTWAQRYYNGLRLGGGGAFSERQQQYCKCCP